MSQARPTITLVVQEFSTNCLGRAFLLGKMLEPQFNLELVGFRKGPTWLPCANHGWPEYSLPWPASMKEYHKAVNDLAGKATGDLVLACKAMPSVLDQGDAITRQRRIPRLLDIDDWEFGWCHPLRLRKAISLLFRGWKKPNGFLRLWWAEIRARQWACRIVSGRFLEHRFGGEFIPHACDTDTLDPAKVIDRQAARQRLGLDQKRIWVGFVGSPKVHKGLEVLCQAMKRLEPSKIGLLVAGAAEGSEEAQLLQTVLGEQVSLRPTFSKQELGPILSAIDITALPQLDIPACRGQMPAKTYDAMAMELPIVASRVSDMSETLAGCGILIPPDDSQALAEAIQMLADNEGQRRSLGIAARKRCLENYSFTVISRKLRQLVQTLLLPAK